MKFQKSGQVLITLLVAYISGCSSDVAFKPVLTQKPSTAPVAAVPTPTPFQCLPLPVPTPPAQGCTANFIDDSNGCRIFSGYTCPTPTPTCQPGSTDPNCLRPLTNFGMITNQTRCVLCHINIYGDLGSADADPFELHENSKSTIFGNIFANKLINRGTYDEATNKWLANVAEPSKNILERLVQGQRLVRVGVDQSFGSNFQVYDNLANGDNDIKFPEFKAGKIKNAAKGRVSQNGIIKIDKVQNGSGILDGRNSMITVDGEIYVEGDLIIHGNFRGVGTIYVNGNIYIPDDIVVENNAGLFSSYRSDITKADQKAKDAITNKASALRLAASGSIIIGDPGVTPAGINFITTAFPLDTRLRNYVANRDNTNYNFTSYYSLDKTQTIFSHTSILNGVNQQWEFVPRTRMEATKSYLTQMEFYGFATSSERSRVFNLDPNYMARLKAEFDLPTQVCNGGKNFRVGFGNVARIDASMYATKSIGGVIAGGGNLLINGGIITRNLSLLAGTAADLEAFNADVAGVTSHRTPHMFEMAKTCADISNTGSGTFKLSTDIVNPQNGVRVGESVITYDYRLRNNGPGFDIMREANY